MIIALDLSLTCTAAVAAPEDWGGNWAKVSVCEFSATPLPKLKKDEQRVVTEMDRTIRIGLLACAIGEKCRDAMQAETIGINRVFLEQRAFAKHNAANGQTADLHAIVKFQLARAGIDFEALTATEARKLLLGKVPRRGQDAKDAVQATFRAAGCPIEWGQDITDALCVLNLAMSRLGGHFFACERTQ